MTLDHREFIERHHKAAQPPLQSRKKPRSYEAFSSMAILILFLSFMVFIYTDEHISELLKIVTIVFSTATGLVFFLIYRSLKEHRTKSDELDLIREVMEGSRGGRLITDFEDKTLYTNQKFEALCRGVGPPEFATLLRLFEDNHQGSAHFTILSEQAHRGLTDSIELFSKFEDQERWLLVTAQPVASRRGCIHWRIDDVTDKHTAESAIRDEREKLIDFTDNAPVGFFSVDEDGRFIFINATLARWLGEDLKTLLDRGTLHTYLAAPPDKARPYDIMEGERPRQITEIKMKGAGGKLFLAAINQIIVEEPDGRVRTHAVVHDLTQTREMSRALKASEDRFQKFFEESPLGILLMDEEGIIVDCNTAFATMLKSDIESLEGQALEEFLNEDDKKSIIVAVDKIQKGGTLDAPLEISLISPTINPETPDAPLSSIDTQIYASCLREGGSITLYILDLSEKKALEAQFAQSQKMQAIGQLAGGVAHDFNNLLTAMIGFCDLLLLRHKPGDPSFGDIMQIKQNSNRAANLVRQLLAFSRQQTLRPRIHDIGDILTEISHLLRRLIGANIDLDLIHGQDLGLVKVDEGQMEQVLINLAVNARDAMESQSGSGTALTISTENFTNRTPKKLLSEEMPPGHWVLIKVTDSGCGIPKENFNRIFEPFFTTKGVGEGTGLGLATVYGIIRQTGGFLDVQSKVGEGTHFFIYLPRANELDEDEEAMIIESATTTIESKDLTGSERILLVEDEDAVRTFSQRALSNKGYDVLTADSGESALKEMEALDGKTLDLLITDVVMPNMDGPTLVQRIRQTNTHLKIIFISGYTEDKLKEHMDDNIFFLPKPFTLKQLAEKVKLVLGG